MSGPVVLDDRRGECFLAGKVGVERALRYPGRVGDVFDAAGGEAAAVDELQPSGQQAATHVGIRGARHSIEGRRPVTYLHGMHPPQDELGDNGCAGRGGDTTDRGGLGVRAGSRTTRCQW
jgi:hypothetical protein